MSERPPVLTYKRKRYYIMPPLLSEGCVGCAFEEENVCPHNDHSYTCNDSADGKLIHDTILIPANDKAIAKWVALRMGADESDNAG